MSGGNTSKIYKHSSRSEKETEEFGRNFASTLKDGDIVLLKGELGAGKTTMVKGILHGLRGETFFGVKSPSYTVLNIYPGVPQVHHFDFYRIENPEDLEELGLNDYWGKGICLVEWPKSFCSSLPGRKIEADISIGEGDFREITILREDEISHESLKR